MRPFFLIGLLTALSSAIPQKNEEQEAAIYSQGVSDAQKDADNHYYGIRVLGNEEGLQAMWIDLAEGESLEVIEVPPSIANREAYREGYNTEARKTLTSAYGYDLLSALEKRAKEYLLQKEKGHKQAMSDIASKQYQIIHYGLPAENAFAYWEALNKRFGVTVEAKGCVVSEDEIAFSEGYNEVVRQTINAKFKRDVFSELQKEFFPEKEDIPSLQECEGAEAAKADVAKGILRTYDDVFSPKWRTAYIRILNEAGVEVVDFDKTAAEKSEDYCYGYDAEARVAIEERLGKYFFDRARGKAQREYNKTKD